MTYVLDDRERATVLAALRWWQIPDVEVPQGFEDFFAGHMPLTAEQIDELCDRLGGAAAGEVCNHCRSLGPQAGCGCNEKED